MAPTPCSSLSHWQHVRIGTYHLYAHPDVELSSVVREDARVSVTLIGYMLHPKQPGLSNTELLQTIAGISASADKIADYLRSVAGRFVLILHSKDDTLLYHDACGLRTVYYTRHEGQTVVGSQPLILKQAVPLSEGERYSFYQQSPYVKANVEHWIPSGCSLYENVHHLVPNHYLRFSSLEQVRYWPTRPIRARGIDDALTEATDLLRGLVTAASNRFSLAMTMTAGWDSRVLLSASRSIADKLFFYTLWYRDMQPNSPDIRVPHQLLRSLGLRHNIIDCRKPIEATFSDLYTTNVSLAHVNDWGQIASGMRDAYPQNRVTFKGSCCEVARRVIYWNNPGTPITSVEQILACEDGWRSIPFARDRVADWYTQSRTAAAAAGIDMRELFYWEHRMGSWQAQSQLEWDLVQEAYTPYNHRGILELLLGIPVSFRNPPDFRFFRMICEALWPEVLAQPVNPRPLSLGSSVGRILGRHGAYGVARSIYRRCRRSA